MAAIPIPCACPMKLPRLTFFLSFCSAKTLVEGFHSQGHGIAAQPYSICASGCQSRKEESKEQKDKACYPGNVAQWYVSASAYISLASLSTRNTGNGSLHLGIFIPKYMKWEINLQFLPHICQDAVQPPEKHMCVYCYNSILYISNN